MTNFKYIVYNKKTTKRIAKCVTLKKARRLVSVLGREAYGVALFVRKERL